MRSPASIDTGFDSIWVSGEIPSRIAVASTTGLKEEPGCRSAWAARLNWLSRKFLPPNIALTAPVRGSIATSAAAGPFGLRRIRSIAVRARFCIFRSMVVRTLRPPPNTRAAPYFAMSWFLT